VNVKRRSIPFSGPKLSRISRNRTDYFGFNGFSLPDYAVEDLTPVWRLLDGAQITESESHAGWKRRDKRHSFNGDSGGPFRTVKQWVESKGPISAAFGGVRYSGYNEGPPPGIPRYTDTYTYTGPLLPLAPGFVQYPPFPDSSKGDLATLGTQAIARCSPSNPSADLAVSIAEIFKDGIPAIVGSTLKQWRGLSNRQRRKAIGGEYLNVEFGWKPFVNDLMKVGSSIIDADTILRQYERDSGRLVRRRYNFPPTTSSTVSTVLDNVGPWYSPSSSSLDPPNGSVPGKVIRTHSVRIDRWFSGGFMYFVPLGGTPQDEMARAVIQARKLLGISLTPDTLWNLAPWSWAVDWFGNVGDVLSNWTDWAIDNQVLAYGYMMEHSVSSYTYTYVGPSGPMPFDIVATTEVKQRIKASPYGFGISNDGLSDRQKAIVAALGLSHSR
jgi:hypothetical protein